MPARAGSCKDSVALEPDVSRKLARLRFTFPDRLGSRFHFYDKPTTPLPLQRRHAISRQRFLRNAERHRVGFHNSRPNCPVVLPLLVQLLHHLRCNRPKVARRHDLHGLSAQVQPRRTDQHWNRDKITNIDGVGNFMTERLGTVDEAPFPQRLSRKGQLRG